MYHPGDASYAYYIASPSEYKDDSVMRVLGNDGGFVSYAPKIDSKNCFCPIIAVSPDYVINFEE